MRKIAIIVLLAFSHVLANGQNTVVDSLERILPTASDSEKLAILQSLIINLWLNHPDSAMAYARQALEVSNRIGSFRDKAIAVRLMGGVHLYKGNYDAALEYSKRAHLLSLESGDSTLISSTLNNIGFTYYHFGSYTEALEYLIRSLNMKRQIHQDYGVGQTLNNLGLVYARLKDFPTARKYFYDALDVSDRLSDNNLKLYSSNNIGFTFLDEGDLSTAERFFSESLETARLVNNNNWHATAYSGLGQVKFRTGHVDEAKKLFQQSMMLRKDIGDKRGVSEIYYLLAMMDIDANRLDSALRNLGLSQDIALNIKSRDRQLENYDLYKTLYTKRKKFDSALYYQSRFVGLRDTLFNENMVRNLANIQLRVKEVEIQNQLKAKDAEIREKAQQTYYLGVVTLLILAFAGILYWYFRKQKQLSQDLGNKNAEIILQKEEIEKQKEEVAQANLALGKAHQLIKEKNRELAEFNRHLQSTVDIRTKELELVNRELKIVNLELDNFIYKSSHDIKGPLVRLLGVCHVALMDVQDAKAREYLEMMYETSKHLNELFDKLKIVSEINGLQLKRDPISFEQIMEQVKLNLKHIEGFDEIAISTTIDLSYDFYSDAFLVETIFHNMIENAVRFQKKSISENKFIKIEITARSGTLVVAFIDNGIGIKQKDIDHIFKMFSKAALEHHTVGLGLYIVKQCVGKLNGSIALVQSNENVTEFEVTLPLTA